MKSAGSLIRAIRGLEYPAAVERLIAEGLTPEQAADFAGDYQLRKWKPPKGLADGPKFTDTPFFQRIREQYGQKDA